MWSGSFALFLLLTTGSAIVKQAAAQISRYYSYDDQSIARSVDNDATSSQARSSLASHNSETPLTLSASMTENNLTPTLTNYISVAMRKVPITTISTNPTRSFIQPRPQQQVAPSTYVKRFRSLSVTAADTRGNNAYNQTQTKLRNLNQQKSSKNTAVINSQCTPYCSAKCNKDYMTKDVCKKSLHKKTLQQSTQTLHASTGIQTQKRTPEIVRPLLRLNGSVVNSATSLGETIKTPLFGNSITTDQHQEQQLVAVLNNTSNGQKYPILMLSKIADDLTKYLKLQAFEFKKRNKNRKHKKSKHLNKPNFTQTTTVDHTDATTVTKDPGKWRQFGVKRAHIGYLSRFLPSAYEPKVASDGQNILLIPKKLDPNRNVFAAKNLPTDYFITKERI